MQAWRCKYLPHHNLHSVHPTPVTGMDISTAARTDTLQSVSAALTLAVQGKASVQLAVDRAQSAVVTHSLLTEPAVGSGQDEQTAANAALASWLKAVEGLCTQPQASRKLQATS